MHPHSGGARAALGRGPRRTHPAGGRAAQAELPIRREPPAAPDCLPTRAMPAEIEALLAAEDWEAARSLIRTRLATEPDSHWLLTRLGLTYYEQRRYRQALRYEGQALRLAPRCPLVLWDYAGTLDMLGRTSEALRIYRRLIRRGVERLAFGECGEGRAWARLGRRLLVSRGVVSASPGPLPAGRAGTGRPSGLARPRLPVDL